SRPGDRLLHRLDPARWPQRAVSGDHRSRRSVAIHERARELKPRTASRLRAPTRWRPHCFPTGISRSVPPGCGSIALIFPRNHHSLGPRTGAVLGPGGLELGSDQQHIAQGVMRAILQKLMIAGVIGLAGVAGLPSRAAEPSAVGLWEQVDES